MNRDVIVLTLILAMTVGLGSCTTTNSPVIGPTVTTTETIDRSFNVPMTGVHIEYFEFEAGDRILARFEVEGKYPVAAGVTAEDVYFDDEGNRHSVANAWRLVDLDYSFGEGFSFIVPKSGRCAFFFGGYYREIRSGENREPFTQLSQVVDLHVIVNPE